MDSGPRMGMSRFMGREPLGSAPANITRMNRLPARPPRANTGQITRANHGGSARPLHVTAATATAITTAPM